MAGDTPNDNQATVLQQAIGEIRRLQSKVAEIQKEREEENEAEANHDSDEEELESSQPLIQALWDAQVPANFKIPQLPSFDGKTDPLEHLMAVGTQTSIIRAEEHLKCKLLSSTFTDAALRWYMNLPNNSVTGYADFHRKFVHQFASSKHVQVTTTNMFALRQGNSETLREYLARFSEATIKVSTETRGGIIDKRDRSIHRDATMDTGHNAGIKNTRANLATRPQEPDNHIMLGPNTNEWSRYHRCKGHDTERCYKLRDLIEELIRIGHLRKFIERAAQGRTGRSGTTKQPRNPPPEDDKWKKRARIAVNTIAGGFAGGGESSSARKRYLRRIERETHSTNHVAFPQPRTYLFLPKTRGE
jgi:hypothetical protein